MAHNTHDLSPYVSSSFKIECYKCLSIQETNENPIDAAVELFESEGWVIIGKQPYCRRCKHNVETEEEVIRIKQ